MFLELLVHLLIERLPVARGATLPTAQKKGKQGPLHNCCLPLSPYRKTKARCKTYASSWTQNQGSKGYKNHKQGKPGFYK